MSKESENSSAPTRRKALKLLGGSAVGLVGLTGTAAAEGSSTTTSKKKEGKSVKIPKEYDNVKSFTVYEGKDLEWHVRDKEMLSTLSHCPGDGGLHWNPGFDWKGYTFDFNIDDCPDTCEWEASITVADQTFSLVTSDECETSEYFDAGVKPINIEGSMRREHVLTGSTVMVIVEADLTANYYSPINGWQEKNISWELEGEA